MKDNFDQALAAVLVHEGGYVNDPQDPGGATNKGVTQAVYDDWRHGQGAAPRSVRQLEPAEVQAIYRHLYWDRIKGDDLPSGVDYATFDFAVNSGVSRAARFLQTAAGVASDGIIGPATIAATKVSPSNVITALVDHRLSFLRSLGTFPRFRKGWTARCNEVRAKALEMVA